MDSWRWIYKRNELIDRIEAYKDSHPGDKEISDFLIEIIELFEKSKFLEVKN